MKRSIKNYDYEKMFRRLGGLISDRKNTDIEWRTYFYECFFGEKKICFKSISCFSLRYKSFCLQTFHELSSFEFLINLFLKSFVSVGTCASRRNAKICAPIKINWRIKRWFDDVDFCCSGWLQRNFFLEEILKYIFACNFRVNFKF